VWLKSHHTAGDTTVASFIDEQRDHGLVPTVNTIEVANGQGTPRLRRDRVGGGRQKASKAPDDFHEEFGGGACTSVVQAADQWICHRTTVY
jgi:hypothetical protein